MPSKQSPYYKIFDDRVLVGVAQHVQVQMHLAGRKNLTAERGRCASCGGSSSGCWSWGLLIASQIVQMVLCIRLIDSNVVRFMAVVREVCKTLSERCKPRSTNTY